MEEKWSFKHFDMSALRQSDLDDYQLNRSLLSRPEIRSALGSSLVREGQWQAGLQLLMSSVSELSTGDDKLAHANALFETGYAHEMLSDWDNARLYYRDALRLYQHINHLAGVAKSQESLGSVLACQGNLEKGLIELERARKAHHQLKKTDRVEAIDSLYDITEKALQDRNLETYA